MNLYQKYCLAKARIKKERLDKFLQSPEKIIDIGAGNAALSFLLTSSGHELTAVDVAKKSAFPEISPLCYDGKKLPFEDKAFDTALLITVLHHCPHPEMLLKEAQRVAKRVIVMEDIYENPFQKYLTYFVDALVNMEFIGHPHSNKTDAAWKACFESHQLELRDQEYYHFLLFFKQVSYLLYEK